ncbi:MAG TPA: hypothetical protein VGJ13_15935 [Pseudonocardiaceae bacterium]|jgi:hypothetical protein
MLNDRRSAGLQPPDLQTWRDAERLVAQDEVRRRRMRLRGVPFGGSPHFQLIGGGTCLVLAVTSLLNVGEPGWNPSYLLGTLFFGGFGAIGVRLGLRLRVARRLLAGWPQPPGA